MAFPTLPSLAESATTSAGTSHIINLPTGMGVGNLLLILTNIGAAAASFNALAGYTELLDEGIANGCAAWAHEINGTEGSTVTLTSSASTKSASIAYHVAGAMPPGQQLPELSTVATGTSVNPDATTCTPTGGAKDYQWITWFGMAGEEADDDTWITGTPTNFTGLRQKTAGTAGTNLGGLIGSANRALNAASLDAPAFTVAVSAAWRAYTLAIHPSIPPVFPMRVRGLV